MTDGHPATQREITTLYVLTRCFLRLSGFLDFQKKRKNWHVFLLNCNCFVQCDLKLINLHTYKNFQSPPLKRVWNAKVTSTPQAEAEQELHSRTRAHTQHSFGLGWTRSRVPIKRIAWRAHLFAIATERGN